MFKNFKKVLLCETLNMNDIKANNIIDLQYFGNIYWFSKLIKLKHITFPLYESYKKMSFRNRSVVASSNGTVNLSVPLESGRNQKSRYGEIKILYSQNWQTNHWQTILSCYNKSPFFEYYRDGLKPFFTQNTEFLFVHNLSILDWLIKTMKLPVTYNVAMEETIITEEVNDFRDYYLPKNYQNINDFPVYPQVFQDRIGFIPNLSILDLLFNTGPQATDILGRIL